MRVLQGLAVCLHNVTQPKVLMDMIQRMGGVVAHNAAAADIIITSTNKRLPPLHHKPVVHAAWILQCYKEKQRLSMNKYSFSKKFKEYATRCGWECQKKGIFVKGMRITTNYNEVVKDLHACVDGAAAVVQRTIRGHQARMKQPTLKLAITGVAGLAPFDTHPRATVALLMTYLRVFHNVPMGATLLHNDQVLNLTTRLRDICKGPLVLHCQHSTS